MNEIKVNTPGIKAQIYPYKATPEAIKLYDKIATQTYSLLSALSKELNFDISNFRVSFDGLYYGERDKGKTSLTIQIKDPRDTWKEPWTGNALIPQTVSVDALILWTYSGDWYNENASQTVTQLIPIIEEKDIIELMSRFALQVRNSLTPEEVELIAPNTPIMITGGVLNEIKIETPGWRRFDLRKEGDNGDGSLIDIILTHPELEFNYHGFWEKGKSQIIIDLDEDNEDKPNHKFQLTNLLTKYSKPFKEIASASIVKIPVSLVNMPLNEIKVNTPGWEKFTLTKSTPFGNYDTISVTLKHPELKLWYFGYWDRDEDYIMWPYDSDDEEENGFKTALTDLLNRYNLPYKEVNGDNPYIKIPLSLIDMEGTMNEIKVNTPGILGTLENYESNVTSIDDINMQKQLAFKSAELVLPIFEKKYPNDDKPRKAIEAFKAYLLNPTEETKNIVVSTRAKANDSNSRAYHAASYGPSDALAAMYASAAILYAGYAITNTETTSIHMAIANAIKAVKSSMEMPLDEIKVNSPTPFKFEIEEKARFWNDEYPVTQSYFGKFYLYDTLIDDTAIYSSHDSRNYIQFQLKVDKGNPEFEKLKNLLKDNNVEEEVPFSTMKKLSYIIDADRVNIVDKLNEIKIENPNAIERQVYFKILSMYPEAEIEKFRDEFIIFLFPDSPHKVINRNTIIVYPSGTLEAFLGDDIHGRRFKHMNNMLKYVEDNPVEKPMNEIKVNSPRPFRFEVTKKGPHSPSLFGKFYFNGDLLDKKSFFDTDIILVYIPIELYKTIKDQLPPHEIMNDGRDYFGEYLIKIDDISKVDIINNLDEIKVLTPMDSRRPYIDDRYVDLSSIELEDVFKSDYPDFADAYISYAEFEDGTELTSEQIEHIQEEWSWIVNDLAHERFNFMNEIKVNAPQPFMFEIVEDRYDDFKFGKIYFNGKLLDNKAVYSISPLGVDSTKPHIVFSIDEPTRDELKDALTLNNARVFNQQISGKYTGKEYNVVIDPIDNVKIVNPSEPMNEIRVISPDKPFKFVKTKIDHEGSIYGRLYFRGKLIDNDSLYNNHPNNDRKFIVGYVGVNDIETQKALEPYITPYSSTGLLFDLNVHENPPVNAFHLAGKQFEDYVSFEDTMNEIKVNNPMFKYKTGDKLRIKDGYKKGKLLYIVGEPRKYNTIVPGKGKVEAYSYPISFAPAPDGNRTEWVSEIDLDRETEIVVNEIKINNPTFKYKVGQKLVSKNNPNGRGIYIVGDPIKDIYQTSEGEPKYTYFYPFSYEPNGKSSGQMSEPYLDSDYMTPTTEIKIESPITKIPIKFNKYLTAFTDTVPSGKLYDVMHSGFPGSNIRIYKNEPNIAYLSHGNVFDVGSLKTTLDRLDIPYERMISSFIIPIKYIHEVN